MYLSFPSSTVYAGFSFLALILFAELAMMMLTYFLSIYLMQLKHGIVGFTMGTLWRYVMCNTINVVFKLFSSLSPCTELLF